MTTYYISSSTGSDSNDGLSSGSPWATLGKVYSKCVSVSKFQPGDSVLLKAGDSWNSGPLVISGVANTGTAGSRITIGRYGEGANPILYGDHSDAVWTAVPGYSGIYSTPGGTASTIQDVYDGVSGTRYTPREQGADDLATWLGKFVAGEWGQYATNKTIYVKTLDGNAPTVMRCLEFAAVQSSYVSYVTFENLDVYHAYFGFYPNNGAGVVVTYCSVTDNVNIGIHMLRCTSSTISYNTVARTGETSIYLTTCVDAWVHHNNVSYTTAATVDGITPPGHDSLERCAIGLQQGIRTIVEHNTMSYIWGSFFDLYYEVDSVMRYNYGFHAEDWCAAPHGTGLRIYANIFNQDGANTSKGCGFSGGHYYDAVRSPAPDSGANVVYNNVVYDHGGEGCLSIDGSGLLIVRNNIFVAHSGLVTNGEFTTGADYDCNFYGSLTGTFRGWEWNGTQHSTLAAFRAASGLESNGSYGDPKFVSATPSVPDDFGLQTTSPCRSAGENLKDSGIIGSTEEWKDYSGRVISSGDVVDIGSYAYTSSGGGSFTSTDMSLLGILSVWPSFADGTSLAPTVPPAMSLLSILSIWSPFGIPTSIHVGATTTSTHDYISSANDRIDILGLDVIMIGGTTTPRTIIREQTTDNLAVSVYLSVVEA